MPQRTTRTELKYMRAEEVADLLRVSKNRAYKIMHKLNKELEEKGKITTAGRISKSYLLERTGTQ